MTVASRVLVAGIGNVFLGDDAFGVEVARRLSDEALPVGVTVADMGIRALHLAYALLDGPELLVVVDAVNRDQPPGTLYLIDPQLELSSTDDSGDVADAHGMNLQTVAAAVRALGGVLPPVRLIGCQPAFVGERMGLSPEVENAVPEAMKMVRATVAETLQSEREAIL
jgi:hydrogenase maturation protease